MPKHDEYRQYAKACEALARSATDNVESNVLLNIASQFRRKRGWHGSKRGWHGSSLCHCECGCRIPTLLLRYRPARRPCSPLALLGAEKRDAAGQTASLIYPAIHGGLGDADMAGLLAETTGQARIVPWPNPS